jgi:hypothetical protein
MSIVVQVIRRRVVLLPDSLFRLLRHTHYTLHLILTIHYPLYSLHSLYTTGELCSFLRVRTPGGAQEAPYSLLIAQEAPHLLIAQGAHHRPLATAEPTVLTTAALAPSAISSPGVRAAGPTDLISTRPSRCVSTGHRWL